MTALPMPRERLRERLRTPVVWINLAGVVLVSTGLASAQHGRFAEIALAVAVPALAAWLVWCLLPAGRAQTALLIVGGLLAAAATGLGQGPLVAAAIAALVVTIADTDTAPALCAGLVTAVFAVLGVTAVVAGMSGGALLSYSAGVAIGAMLGLTRRQRRVAELRERTLLEQSLRTRLLEDRATVARDIHDVLAHSLGGLVLQLDAIDALLEHGRPTEAAARVAQARLLAADGLAEARHAVSALREPDSRAPAADSALDDLLAIHRSLGGRATTSGDLSLAGLDAAHRAALVRALQEALSNARRHAPDTEAVVRAAREGAALSLIVRTTLPTAAAPSPGGGHGLAGMRERFAALGDGSTVTAEQRDGEFVVAVRMLTR